MLGTGKSSQTKTRLLLQGSSCHLRPSLYLLSRRAIHASLPQPFGLRVPSGCLRPVGPVVLQLLYCHEIKKRMSHIYFDVALNVCYSMSAPVHSTDDS